MARKRLVLVDVDLPDQSPLVWDAALKKAVAGTGGGLTDVNDSGLLSARPAIGTVDEDFVYFATDTGQGFVARGGVWQEIIPAPITDYTTTAEAQALVDVHTGDTVDAHDASAVSVDPSGLIIVTTTNVQAALAQLDAAVTPDGEGVIARVTLNPNAEVDFTSVTTAALGDVGNGAQITVTVPASGVVKLRAKGGRIWCSGDFAVVGWREGTTEVAKSGPYSYVSTNGGVHFAYEAVIEGLVPGSSHTYKLAAGCSGGAFSTRLRWGGATAGFGGCPLVLEAVDSAPL
jgi:hypothetical protein